ncbi:MAG: tyrosine-type recombinase/integrase [Actinobacteria bacterium]|nr:tyrosine-type recombinase/integrase [Actinomycetota bacterium]
MAVSSSLVLYDRRSAEPEVVALAGFLAGHGGRTREAYTLDLRQFYTWCESRRLRLFDVHRSDIELYARELEELGRARATIGRRLSTIAGFYRYAAEEGIIEHSPAVHVRRPRLDYESHAVGLDRNELGAFLVAAGLASPQDHALASLLALNGLRISEALGANIEDLGLERGHRTLLVHRKGGKTVTIPLAPRTARAVDLAIGDRLDGPIFLDSLGRRLRRDAAARMVRRLAKQAGITKRIGPHSLRHSFITAALDAGVPLRDVQEAASHADPRTTMRYDRARQSLDRLATYIVAAFVAGASRGDTGTQASHR